ncbi:porin [Antarcticimicrobium luteum]|uniref:Porin domain-containing protein n=1 Tax=Antarcticimicrobium luteum TaxID=2547397 RepID=A0A4R5VFT5_9RHOB|nr:porin [Antarcticimicrobium luteum]TDK51576.1 hypothetical protein E1832_02950 [Antarcticimicrobium luteum]
MSKTLTAALALGAPFVICASGALAQERFSWDGEIEIGYESIIDSTVPANEGDAAYATGEFNTAFALSDRVTVFGGLTFEELEDASGTTGYGFYLHELGLQFETGAATFQLGKVSPAFGTAWVSAAGFYGAALAEDYELTEQIGVLAEADLGAAGTLALGLFYADDTGLSDSLGFNRGRNSSAAGGAGNTGKLNNAALQWSGEWDATFAYAGVRFLSAGVGDVGDETGFVAGLGHSLGNGLDLFGEVAAFDGYGGTADDATYATLNAAYAIGEVTLSGTYSMRDVTSAGRTDLVSAAAEYELANGMTLGGALARIDDAGTKDTLLGVNLVIPFGG